LHSPNVLLALETHMTRTIHLGSALLALWLAGCGGAKKESQGPSSNVLYAAARNITPAVASAAPTASFQAVGGAPMMAAAATMPWWSGNMGGLIFQTLRDYQYPRDEGKVDATNIYKVLLEAGNEFERRYPQLTAITEKAVASPFDFGPFTVADTYDKAKNNVGGATVHMAARQAGNDKHMLVAAASGDATWITQGVYRGDSKDLELNSMMIVRYTSGSMAGDVYGIRSYILGNETTHAFTFRFLQFSSNSAGGMHYYYSVIGTGISQGTGGHFLFYGRSTLDPSPFGGPATGYYCFQAGDAEAEYQAKFTAFPPAEVGGGEVIDASSPCLAYKEGATGLDAQLAAIPLWGPADVTFDPATFTGAGASHLELVF
jgi:hypothetical protein